MEQCLIDNKVCSEQNKKCKVCKLDKSKEVLQMIEDEERYIDIGYMNKLKKSLPEQCKNCSFFDGYKSKTTESILSIQNKR